MKLACIVCFLLIVFKLNAQEYNPLLANINEWHFTTCYSGCITDVYYTDGDTLVNGKNYKILDGYHFINRNVLLREDVDEKKVYLTITQPQYEEDIVLYDFSLPVGDSIVMRNPQTPFPNNGGYFTLDSIQSVQQMNGVNNRHFYFTPSETNNTYINKIVWVEGVGSTSMINAPGGLANFNGVGKLSCAFKNEALYYSDLTSVDSCNPTNLSVSETNLPKIEVYSKPETNQFVITNATDVLKINVYGINAKHYLSNKFKDQNQITIDLSELNSGLYILILQLNTSETINFKVVVR